jgi:hypothetical protein
MLCASQHHAKDIAELVSRMVSSSDQCAVIAPPDALPRNVVSDEEADDEGYTSASATSDSPPSSRRGTIAKRAIAQDIRYRRQKTAGEKNSVA